MFFLNNFRTFVVVKFASASALTHLVILSISTIKYLSCPGTEANGPRMCSPRCRKGRGDIKK